MIKNSTSVITRFAPSPTGFLHLGGARTALFNFLLAKHLSGNFILRIDDTDTIRNKDKYLENIFDSLEWLGISYDSLIFQSQRTDIYTQYLNMLLEQKLAYVCNCSTERLNILRDAQKTNKDNIMYDRMCATLEHPLNDNCVVRLRLPLKGKVSWHDAIRGTISFDNINLDDFIILRSDKQFTYNFCSVIDDIVCNISHVIRGEDHITNTAKQIHIYHAFNTPSPIYAHLPLLISDEGSKISKRSGALDVLHFRDLGYLKEGLLNFLARLGWANKNQELFTIEDLKSLFNLKSISKSPAKINETKLDWYNFQHLKLMDSKLLLERLKAYADTCGLDIHYLTKNKYCYEILDVFKNRSKTLRKLIDDIAFLSKNCAAQNYSYLHLHYLLEAYLEKWDDNIEIKIKLHDYCRDNEVSFSLITSSIRMLITGTTTAPDVSLLLKWVGREEVLARLKANQEI